MAHLSLTAFGGGCLNYTGNLLRAASGFVASALLLSACAAGSATETTPTQTITVPPQSSEGSPDTAATTAAQVFLAAVCPTDSAVQNISQAALAAGGWTSVSPRDIHPLAQWAVESVRSTATSLDANQWPTEVAPSIPGVSEEYLAMLRPLTTLSESNSGDQLRSAWQFLDELGRTNEQAVRIELGLGPVDSNDDGCPPPQPIPSRPATPTPSSPASGSGPWTSSWQSPSGNIRCGFTPQGSTGLPTVACLVSDENRLVKMSQGSDPMYSPSATESQRAQLPGGRTLEYGAYISVGPFECWQSPPDGVGMTCTDVATGHGFSIRRGSFLSF
jgi:hypothetical protein